MLPLRHARSHDIPKVSAPLSFGAGDPRGIRAENRGARSHEHGEALGRPRAADAVTTRCRADSSTFHPPLVPNSVADDEITPDDTDEQERFDRMFDEIIRGDGQS